MWFLKTVNTGKPGLYNEPLTAWPAALWPGPGHFSIQHFLIWCQFWHFGFDPSCKTIVVSKYSKTKTTKYYRYFAELFFSFPKCGKYLHIWQYRSYLICAPNFSSVKYCVGHIALIRMFAVSLSLGFFFMFHPDTIYSYWFWCTAGRHISIANSTLSKWKWLLECPAVGIIAYKCPPTYAIDASMLLPMLANVHILPNLLLLKDAIHWIELLPTCCRIVRGVPFLTLLSTIRFISKHQTRPGTSGSSSVAALQPDWSSCWNQIFSCCCYFCNPFPLRKKKIENLAI